MTVRPLSSTNASKALGDQWHVCVIVIDAFGCPVESAPVVTVTLPDSSTDTPDVETITTGVYRVLYDLTTAGRFLAHVVADGYGAADFAAYVTEPTTGDGMPTLDDVADYLVDSSWSDDELTSALDAESAAQRSVCRVGAVYPADLREALLRRVARNLAMRSLPLAAPSGDSDAAFIPGRDPEIRRLEAPWRKLVVG